MRTDRAVVILLSKELRAELRSRELLQTTLIFALIVVVLFSFAFDPTAAESRRFGPGLLWIAFLFAGTLMLNPSFAREQANDTLQALRMAPISSFALLLGKILANFVFLLAAELVLKAQVRQRVQPGCRIRSRPPGNSRQRQFLKMD